MKLLLISPPFQYFPGSKKQINYIRPPLGLLYLASYIQSKFDIHIKIIDSNAEAMNKNDLIDNILFYQADIIGFSITTATVNISKEIILETKKKLKQSLFIVGGPHITALPKEFVDVADISVLNEGEKTLEEIILYYQNKKSLKNIQGIVYQKKNKIYHNRPRTFIQNLDELPFPNRTLLQEKLYRPILDYNSKGKFTTLFASRGCYYHCTFCANEKLWNSTVRFRSIENVMNEIEILIKQNYTTIFIDDDNFMSHSTYVKQFCDKILEKKLKFNWIIHARIKKYDKTLLNLMYQAGCKEVQLGIETFNLDSLHHIKKKIHVDMIYSCIENFRNSKIITWATLILGLPLEDKKTIQKSIHSIIKANPTYATFIMLLPFPGTQIFLEYKKKNFIKTYNWNDYSWHGDPVFETDTLSTKDLIDLRKYAYRKFYFRIKKLFEFFILMIQYNMIQSMIKNMFRFLFFSFNNIINKTNKRS